MLIDFWSQAAWRPSAPKETKRTSRPRRNEFWRKQYLIERKALRLKNHGSIKSPQHARERVKLRKRYDVHFRISLALSSRLAHAVRRNSGVKAARTVELIGCSIEKLRLHLEGLFVDGMSWENYGTWHVDHKKPCAKFDLSNPAQQRACFHFSNLQPLWGIDNIRKGAKEIYT